MKYSVVCILCIFLFGFIVVLLPANRNKNLKIDVQEYILDNGFKVLIVKKPGSTIACRMLYNVGAINENVGKTGISHFLEHMMFKGTDVIGTVDFEKEKPLFAKEDKLIRKIRQAEKNGDHELLEKLRGELSVLRERLEALSVQGDIMGIFKEHGGAGVNAFTSYDCTCYICNLPSNKLELWCFIESSIMNSLAMREFYTEIDVVLEEQRMRYQDSPSGFINLKMSELLFPDTPYGRPIGGLPQDIKSYTREDVREYYKNYYVPNNAVMILVGDVDEWKALALIEKYFGHLKRGKVKELDVSQFVLPAQEEEQLKQIKFPASPRTVVGYRTVPTSHDDEVVLDFISMLLSNGKTSILNKALRDTMMVSNVATYDATMKYAGAFKIAFAPMAEHDTEDIERIIYQELEKLQNGQILEEDLRLMKKRAKVAFLKRLDSIDGIAGLLRLCEVSFGDWRKINDLVLEMEEVTINDIARVAKKYSTASNRSVVRMIRDRKEEINYEN